MLAYDDSVAWRDSSRQATDPEAQGLSCFVLAGEAEDLAGIKTNGIQGVAGGCGIARVQCEAA
jgi:hypothetical protein